MSETALLIIEIVIVVYLLAGLYVTTMHQEKQNTADSRVLLEELIVALFWPFLFIKTLNKLKFILFMLCLGIIFVFVVLAV